MRGQLEASRGVRGFCHSLLTPPARSCCWGSGAGPRCESSAGGGRGPRGREFAGGGGRGGCLEPVLGVERGWVGGHRLGKHSEHSLGELAFSLSTQGEGQPSHPCPTRLCGPGSCQGRPAAVAEQEPPSALQDLEPQQLLLFVQSFGIPVSSMSKLLQYLDQAVAHDPQTLEQNIMDKSEPWGPRRALGGGGRCGARVLPDPLREDLGPGVSGGGLPPRWGPCSPPAAALQITWLTWWRFSTSVGRPEARPSTPCSQPPCPPGEVPTPWSPPAPGLLQASEAGGPKARPLGPFLGCGPPGETSLGWRVLRKAAEGFQPTPLLSPCRQHRGAKAQKQP